MGDIHVTMPMGIGDVHWVLTKMRAFREHVGAHKLIAHIAHGQNHQTTNYVRLTDLFDEVHEDRHGLRGVPPGYMEPRWSTIDGSHGYHRFDFCFQANGHLERGEPLSTWLPELGEPDYEVPLKLNPTVDQSRVLLYPSGTGPNQGFKTNWRREQWQAIVALLNHHGIRPTFVGASTPDDMGYWRDLRIHGDFEDLVGKTTTQDYVTLIMNCRAWMGLNSGGGILAGSYRRKTVMLWSDSDHGGRLHPKMATGWLPASHPWYHWFSYGKPGMEQAAADRLVQLCKETV